MRSCYGHATTTTQEMRKYTQHLSLKNKDNLFSVLYLRPAASARRL
jgi:hypothetical protein